MSNFWEMRRSEWGQQPDDARSPYDVDYSRVVHSGSFRRLQGKTQILNLGDSDFYRTRLTHSLEVAQIAAGIVRQLDMSFKKHPAHAYLPPLSMIQAIGFTHDLGHPPFGHGGEVALNYCMRDAGGFEGNGQTLRILSKLENFSKNHGSDLTRRSLLGVLKYPVAYSALVNSAVLPSIDEVPTTIRIIDRIKSKPPKCFLDSEQDVADWILRNLSEEDRKAFCSFAIKENGHSKPVHKSFDCSIMDISDDIAYGVHDLEDAIALRLIDENQFRNSIKDKDCSSFLDALQRRYKNECGNDAYNYFISGLFADGKDRKRFIGRLVHHFMTDVQIETKDKFMEPLIRYRAVLSPDVRNFLEALKKIVVDLVIKSPSVQHLEFKGQKMVVSVFEAFQSEPESFLPKDDYAAYCATGGGLRVLCDYVSGMTDGFLLKTYDRLFSPRMGSIFDQL